MNEDERDRDRERLRIRRAGMNEDERERERETDLEGQEHNTKQWKKRIKKGDTQEPKEKNGIQEQDTR